MQKLPPQPYDTTFERDFQQIFAKTGGVKGFKPAGFPEKGGCRHGTAPAAVREHMENLIWRRSHTGVHCIKSRAFGAAQ